MKILSAADHRRMPWKNGGGETVEIAIFPPDASVSDFDWRISMATVASDGPFSIFPDVDRTLSVLDGEGIILSTENAPDIELTPASDPHTFPGDLPSSAKLLGGRITDLNVMANRAHYRHCVRRVEFDGTFSVQSTNGETFIVLISDELECSGKRIGRFDTIILEAGETVSLRSTVDTVLLAIEISAVR